MSRLFDDASSEALWIPFARIASAPLSMAVWINTDDDSTFESAICLCDIDQNGNDFISLELNNSGEIRAQIDSTAATATPTGSALTAGTWYHVAVTGDGLDWTVYLNGAAVGTSETDVTLANLDTLGIGARWDSSPDRFFSGRMFWAAIWNVVLTPTEIQHLSDGREPVFVRRDALVMFARLMADEDMDVINGTVLTAVNTPSVSNNNPDTMIRALPRGRGRGRHRFT